MPSDLSARIETAAAICREAGALALRHYRNLAALTVERKGHQDLVSEADREVERLIRDQLAAHFPDDGIVGEEHAPRTGTSGYTWVIDPIDGTANFLRGIPAWCVVLACVHESHIVVGVIYDPVHDELYAAGNGTGTTVNGVAARVAAADSLGDGTLGVGSSNRSKPGAVVKIIERTLASGGVFCRNGSGALSLAYVAAGRLIGYVEDHMNAWDCLAGQLLVREAGGLIETQDADDMLARGGRVVVSAPAIFDDLRRMCDEAF